MPGSPCRRFLRSWASNYRGSLYQCISKPSEEDPEDSKGRDTPITNQDEELPVEQWTQFGGVVGILMYMSTDRPDIQYTVNVLSSLMSKPTQRGWESAKHLVKYLLKTKGYALFFGREAENCDDVIIMTDSDWATDQQNRKSKSAVRIYVGDCLLYSYTRRQTVIAQSSAEAEFYATASGVSEFWHLLVCLGTQSLD